MVGFIKQGKEAQEEYLQQKAAAEMRQTQSGDPRRFWLDKANGNSRVTFLDGNLNDKGFIEKNAFWEHQINMGGGNNFQNFVCIEEEEPCPFCEMHKSSGATGKEAYKGRKSFVLVFTIIDHRPWTDKEGNEHTATKKLFVCKQATIDQLQVFATKFEGLRGVTFDITRTGQLEPRVGNIFVAEGKIKTAAEFTKQFGKDKDLLQPYDYNEIIKHYTGEELAKLGFVVPQGIGSEVGPTDTLATDSKDDSNIPF